LDPGVIEDPYEFYADLRAPAPVWRVPGTPILVVTSFAAVSGAVGRTEEFSSNLSALIYRRDDGTPGVEPFGGEWTNVLATADPPMHTLHRATVFPELMRTRMATLRPGIDALVVDPVCAALERPDVEFMGALANAVPIRVVSRLVGWQDEDPEELLRAAVESSAVLGGTRSLAEAHDAMARTAAVGAWITEQLDRAIATENDGLLGVLAEAVRAG
jgi:cytochrome P450